VVRGRRAVVYLAIALLGILAPTACGDDDDSTPTPTTVPSPFPTAKPSASPSPTPEPQANEPPERDLADLARRFLGLPAGAPLVARTEPYGYAVGDSATFTLVDLEGPSEYEVTATARAITDHAYFFVDDESSYDEANLAEVAEDFESIVWPAVTGAFGEPATPGVDGDPRITILNAPLLGAAGYVSGADSFPRSIAPHSNEREMLYIDVESLSEPGLYYNGLVAHEFQHLIHARADSGEDSWVNEGLSQVASQLVGDGDEWIDYFTDEPDTQLDFWPVYEDSTVNYAAAELFFSYLLDQYGGRENAAALIDEQGDGVNGVDAYVDAFDTTFAEIFIDWVVANWLDDGAGPYSHPKLDHTTTVSETISEPGEDVASVHQLAADYLEIEGGAGNTFDFEGEQEVSIGVPEHDGAFWWSNRGDSIDSRLTRRVDLSDVDTATLTFDTWYDIEEGWDYGYVAVSADGGETWAPVAGRTTTTDNPTGASYGEAFTGSSGDWIEEEVDLSAHAGEQVLLRFEMITDDAGSITGMAVDNIAIAEIDFADGAEDDSGWEAEGWQRIDKPLEQEWALRYIDEDGIVHQLPVTADGSAGILLGGAATTVVVVALTRGTAEPASYSWAVSP
jgi:hypothetical protein